MRRWWVGRLEGRIKEERKDGDGQAGGGMEGWAAGGGTGEG